MSKSIFLQRIARERGLFCLNGGGNTGFGPQNLLIPILGISTLVGARGHAVLVKIRESYRGATRGHSG